MKKKIVKKLELAKETVRNLEQLKGVQGRGLTVPCDEPLSYDADCTV